MRPYDPRAIQRQNSGGSAVSRHSHSEPRYHGPGNSRAMMPLRGSGANTPTNRDPFAGGSIFGGRDPFAEFGSMMPFGGGGGGPFGRGGMPDMMGGIMSNFDRMTQDMMKDFGSMRGGPGGGISGFGNMANMGDGAYACQSFAMSSVTGPDGKQHVEKYSSSDIGNSKHKIREGQQAYSNSTTGMQKIGMERQHADQGRKMVRERNGTGEERCTEMFRGMDESHKDQFDRDFATKAHHMPQHFRGNFSGALGGALGGGSGGALPSNFGQRALPGRSSSNPAHRR